MHISRCLLLLSFCLPAFAQDFEPAIKQIQSRIQQRPDDPSLHYFLSSFQARAKRLDEATASMAKVAELGDGFLPVPEFGFENLKDHAPFQALKAKMAKAAPLATAASVTFRIPDKTFIPEGIAFDKASNSFYVGSVAQRKIVRVGRDGKAVPFSKPSDGLHEVLGLAIDQRRRVLYAVSTSGVSVQDKPHNSVVRYNLENGDKTAEFLVPAARQLNDLAIHPDGSLFVTDSVLGQVFRIDTHTGRHTVFIATGSLGGTNGVALSGDGATLYIAHSTGIARADVASGKVERIASPARQSLAAIDGLYFLDGDLLGVQSITNPGRVIRIGLNKAHEVTRVDTLLSHHHPDIDQPTTGVVAGDAFHLLATTQVSRYTGPGKLGELATLREPVVLTVPLLTPGASAARFWRALSSNAGQKPDVEAIRALFHPSAMVFGGRNRDGKGALSSTPVKAFLADIDAVRKAPFYECEVVRETVQFDRFAHVYSVVESRTGGADPAFTGVNSLQMQFDGSAWKILSLYYQLGLDQVPVPLGSAGSGHCLDISPVQ
jgi:DNA-binding beta-propeller fold protein YncE